MDRNNWKHFKLMSGFSQAHEVATWQAMVFVK